MPDVRPSHTPPIRWGILLFVHLAALAGLALLIARQLEPIPMHDLKLADGERLKCVSYAPHHLPGQTPFDDTLKIPVEQIRADLTALSRMTECVRLYAVAQGLDQVPAVARELGLKVLLGAWISSDRPRSAAELDHAIRVANDNADVVRMLIVGNVVLLRRERTEDELRGLIDYARARVRVPVSYADVWEFWLRHPRLEQVVDRVTVHILPFWEDDPVAIDKAVGHVGAVFEEVRSHFAKPVMIGETGWPSAGRQREASLPSLVNQARYIREFIHRAHDEGWDYNLIEAIDQPWKRQLEGTVGGYWGVLDVALAAKFPLAGPVSERNGLAAPVLAAGLGALLCVALAATGPAAGRRALRLAALAAIGATAGVIAVLHWEHASVAYRNAFEWSLLGTVFALGALVPLTLARGSDGGIRSGAAAWRALRAGGAETMSAATLLGLLRLASLFAAATAALLLFVDPRYRDFPTLLYLVPALAFGAAGWFATSRHAVEERACAAVIAISVLGRWLTEPANPQAIAWLLAGLILAAPTLRRSANEDQ